MGLACGGRKTEADHRIIDLTGRLPWWLPSLSAWRRAQAVPAQAPPSLPPPPPAPSSLPVVQSDLCLLSQLSRWSIEAYDVTYEDRQSIATLVYQGQGLRRDKRFQQRRCMRLHRYGRNARPPGDGKDSV